MMLMMAPVACIISIIGAPFHQFGGIRPQPFCFVVCFMMAFGWHQDQEASNENEHIWLKPRFWAQNHGFGPDVVTFGVNPSKTTTNDFIWPKPRFWAREPGFGPDVVIFGVLGGNPRKCAACVARTLA